MTSIAPGAAANAYASLAKIADPSGGLARKVAAAAPGKENFGGHLQNALSSLAEQGKATDQKAHMMAAGKADIVDVATAVAETEVAIETLVSVRDRVIQAYEEIMRMPI